MIDVLAMLPAFALGWIIVRLLAKLPWAVEIPLGIGLGSAISSAAFFLMTWAGVASRLAILSFELASLAAGSAILFRSGLKREAAKKKPQPAWIWALRIAAGVALILAAMDFSQSIAANPDGGYDAAAIWNLRARYLAGGAQSWRFAVSDASGANHPGYPLLVSGFIARTSTLIGDFRSSTPAALSGLFTLATLSLLFGAVATLAGEALGWLALLVLAATEGFMSQAAIQYADIPLSLAILASVALLAIAESRSWPSWMLALAGLFAGAAAWTKNEGLPFAGLLVIIALWRAGLRSAIWTAIGALPFVLVTFALKFFLVQGTESMFPSSVRQIAKMLVDLSRWPEILASFAKNFRDLGPLWAHPFLLLGVLAWALGFNANPQSRWWLFIAPVGLLAADCAIYLITMSGLTWHLATSNNRLIAQVWPTLIFGFLMLLNRFDSPGREARP